jgi:hypothetical protein
LTAEPGVAVREGLMGGERSVVLGVHETVLVGAGGSLSDVPKLFFDLARARRPIGRMKNPLSQHLHPG